MVADVLDAHADEVAATTAALLQGLRRTPDMLLTDGELALRTPRAARTFLLRPHARAPHGRRGRTAGAGRRAPCGNGVGQAAGWRSSPPIRRGRWRAPSCEGPSGAPSPSCAPGTRARSAARARDGPSRTMRPTPAPSPEALRTRPDIADELLSALGCCALALLALVPLNSMIHEGAWQGVVPALLLAGGVHGLARRRAPALGACAAGRARAMMTALLAVADSCGRRRRCAHDL